ncbi:hypothetical protein [Aquimarina aggregata]|uniref:hypothetical protein n=1 Tax=Aquimarina aggregata TaxID=1642818 RepID=UPI0024918CAF|nr:hypothetical protein [Aquimarina aggregata]
MSSIIKHIQIIDRIDQLIRLQATGSPEVFADRLGVSKTKLYRILNTMKALNAPIVYDMTLQSFIYQEEVNFACGFYEKEINNDRLSSFVW